MCGCSATQFVFVHVPSCPVIIRPREHQVGDRNGRNKLACGAAPVSEVCSTPMLKWPATVQDNRAPRLSVAARSATLWSVQRHLIPSSRTRGRLAAAELATVSGMVNPSGDDAVARDCP